MYASQLNIVYKEMFETWRHVILMRQHYYQKLKQIINVCYSLFIIISFGIILTNCLVVWLNVYIKTYIYLFKCFKENFIKLLKHSKRSFKWTVLGITVATVMQ